MRVARPRAVASHHHPRETDLPACPPPLQARLQNTPCGTSVSRGDEQCPLGDVDGKVGDQFDGSIEDRSGDCYLFGPLRVAMRKRQALTIPERNIWQFFLNCSLRLSPGRGYNGLYMGVIGTGGTRGSARK
jgi:hypothetical protein